MTSIRKINAALIGLITLIAVGACATPATPRPTVLIYGDSLTVQSEAAAQALDPGERLMFRAQGGTGACDFIVQAASDRAIFHPQRVVFAWSGNVSNCDKDAYVINDCQPLADSYTQTLESFLSVYSGIPQTIVLPPAFHNPGTPKWYPCNGNPALVAAYQAFINDGVHIVTLADTGLTPHHVYRVSGAAYPHGAITVLRAADGIHLTPAGAQWFGAALVAR